MTDTFKMTQAEWDKILTAILEKQKEQSTPKPKPS